MEMNDTSTLKEEIHSLYEKKRLLEELVTECLERLEISGVGLDEPLVDSEGFPRNDVDLVSVTADRRQLKELSNDHKILMAEIERKLHKLHAETRGEEGTYFSPPQHTRDQSTGLPVEAPLAVPATSVNSFAVVDLVFENSPAMAAGLQEGDEVVRCAHITSQTPNNLETMGKLVSDSENRELNIDIRRGEDTISLKLTPMKWSGRGLLGCHLHKKHY